MAKNTTSDAAPVTPEINPIPDFVSWCAEVQFELPVPVAMAEVKAGEDSTNENRKRTGAKEPLYPPAYFAGQYTDLWKIPHAADAVYYQSVNKKKD